MSRKTLMVLAVALCGLAAALPAPACNWYCDGCECRFSMSTTNMYCNTQWGCCFEEQAGGCFAPADDPDPLGLFGGELTGEPVLACAGDAAPAATVTDATGASTSAAGGAS